MMMMVVVMVVFVHLLVHILHIASCAIVRLVVGVVDDVVFRQVMEDWSVFLFISLLMANLVHLSWGSEMLDGYPDVSPFVF
jgi:hypothetical protein